MSVPGPSLREQGLQALQAGNLDRAVDFLARAVMADDKDADAKALLGVAYSQKGLHPQAKRALQTATELQPENANFRFNLGVALERAGDQQGAAIAYRDTLQLNKDHTQARAKLQAMGPQGHQLLANAPKPIEPVGVPTYNTPQPGVAPPATAASNPGQPAHPMGAPAGYAPPPAPAPDPGYGGGATLGEGPPGTLQCPSCYQWSKPGMVCEFCAAPLPPPPRPVAPPPAYASASASAALPVGAYSPAVVHDQTGGYGTSSDMGGFEAFGLRWLAVIIDHLILSAITIPIALALGTSIGVLALLNGEASPQVSERAAAAEGLAQGISLGIFIGYEVVLTAIWGRTLGKMVFGLHVVDEMGDRVGWIRCIFRATIGRIVGGCVFGMGYWSVIWNDEQRGWHDQLCGTHVVRR